MQEAFRAKRLDMLIKIISVGIEEVWRLRLGHPTLACWQEEKEQG